MALTWRERLVVEPEWNDIARWPFVDPTALAPESRRGFLTNRRAVAKVLSGQSLKSVSETVNLSAARISQLMTRCLGGDENAPPALSKALVPHQRLVPSSRQSALSTLAEEKGARCGFSYLLETVPGLREHLHKHIRHAVKRSQRGQNLTPRGLHAVFITHLKSQNWPMDTYPFTSASQGYESIRRFLKRELETHRMPRLPVRVISANLPPIRAFREIHIDEASVDCHGSIAVILNNQMKPHRLARISILLARDIGTGCYLAATIALTTHPNAADVLALLEQLIQPWSPMVLTAPGLSYTANAGFPTALGEAFCRPSFGIIRMDNALAHLSHTVRRMICDHLGATCNFGLPKNPKARAMVEQAFRRLNVDIHRLPSSTGTSPIDPRREPLKNQKKAPLISLDALEQTLSVLLTEQNLKPAKFLGGVSPMEQIQHQMTGHFLPLRAPDQHPGLQPFERARTVTVRKGFSADSPRINFEGCQYRGAAINDADLLNQKVQILFDIRDIRTLRVCSLDGRALGTVMAPKTWQRFGHSVALRKRINTLVRERQLSSRDPMGEYFDYTLAHRHLPKEALTLLRIDRNRTQTAKPLVPEVAPELEKMTVDRLEDALKRLPDWNPDMARKRKKPK